MTLLKKRPERGTLSWAAMTHPAPQAQAPAPSGPPPKRLAFLTVPLLISLFFNAISLLTLPFSRDTLNETISSYDRITGMTLPPLTPDQIQWVMWLSFFITAALILWLYNTRRGLLAGKSWARVSSVVIAVGSLLFFPVGTLLGIVMLIGAFDRDVTNYTSRK